MNPRPRTKIPTPIQRTTTPRLRQLLNLDGDPFPDIGKAQSKFCHKKERRVAESNVT